MRREGVAFAVGESAVAEESYRLALRVEDDAVAQVTDDLAVDNYGVVPRLVDGGDDFIVLAVEFDFGG